MVFSGSFERNEVSDAAEDDNKGVVGVMEVRMVVYFDTDILRSAEK